MDRSLGTCLPHAAHRQHLRGFTILEVMVALAILTFALTGIYKLHGQTMMVSAKSRFFNVAPTLAQSKLSEIERLDYKSLTTSSGDFGNAYPGYQWSLQIEDVTTELLTEKYYHLTRIDIDIARHEQNQYHLRTYRFFVD